MKHSLLIASFCLCGAFLQAQEQSSPKAYMVSNAHLDTQWNWDIVTTIDKYVKNTLYQNLFLLDKYPNYVFNFEGGIKYYWMKEYYPEKYEELKERIKEGRWHIAGSSWEAADAVVPSPESAIRNILLGQTFYRKEFNAEGTDIFLPDCFGFPWTLPTVAAHCGLIGFSSQKLAWRTNPFYGEDRLPFTIGLWKGIDGSQIMFAHGYDYTQKWKDEDLSDNEQLKGLVKETPLNMVNRYYGTGDIGGSPTLESVRAVEKGISGKGPLQIISATSDELFKSFQPYSQHPELPVFSGELLMDVHGTGCYTSQAAMKLYNRQNEKLGDAAERAAVAADWLGTVKYPSDDLTSSWRRFIFHQFHDDLTGTSIPKAYEYSWNDELISLKQFSDIITTSVSGVASQMDTRVKGQPLVIYNPNGFSVDGIVEFKVNPEKGYAVYDQNGREVSAQMIEGSDGTARIIASAKVAANSYTVYDLRKGNVKLKSIAENISEFENTVYKIKFDANGDICSIYDKRHKKELVEQGKAVRLAMFTENKSHAWPAWEVIKETIDKKPVSITEGVNITLVENGSLRKTVCVEKKYGKSIFKQYVRLNEGAIADRIDFDNEIFWQSTNSLLKAEFPLTVANPNATYDLGIGTLQRGNNTLTAYEVYAHEWADLTDSDNSYGVSIMNDSKYGWDKPSDNTIRLTLLHTPETKWGFSYQDKQDFGYHEFSYSIMGHAGALDKAHVSEIASGYNRPLIPFFSEKHSGKLGREYSFASCDNKNVLIKAIKKAEDSDEYVVRVYETSGREHQKAKIRFAGQILEAYLADGTEKKIGKAEFEGNSLHVDINPYSVCTYKVVLANREPLFKTEYAYLSLPYDKKCFSWNEFRHEADFSSGYSYAAELLPEKTLVSAGVPFELGEKEVCNGMSCKGQVITMPVDKGYNRLYLLAASSDVDNLAEFNVGGDIQKVSVPCYNGFIGQWGHTGHTKGFLKDGNIAYVGTHRHSASGDGIYEFTYMYRIALDVPEGTSEITFPDIPGVVVFAATLVKESSNRVIPGNDMFVTAITEPDKTLVKGENLLRKAKVIDYSAMINDSEKVEYAVDSDLTTKWCDVTSSPSFITFDLGKEQDINGWKLVNAGVESASYITSDCFLQGKVTQDEPWKTIDRIVDNKTDIIMRDVNKVSCRYLRLVITRPEQDPLGNATRIYEVEVY